MSVQFANACSTRSTGIRRRQDPLMKRLSCSRLTSAVLVDFRNIREINTCQAAFETLALLNEGDFMIRVRVVSQGQLFGRRVRHGHV